MSCNATNKTFFYPWKGILRHKQFIFTYGTLMLSSSQGIPSKLYGFKRVANYVLDNKYYQTESKQKYAAFNLIQTNKCGDYTNGVLIPFSAYDLDFLRKEEYMYDMTLVSVIPDKGGNVVAHCLVCNNELYVNNECLPHKQYLSKCKYVATLYGNSFQREYQETSYYFQNGKAITIPDSYWLEK